MFLYKEKICSFYDDNDDTFRVGYLVDIDEQFAIFNIYTTRGYEDGLYLTRKEDIFRVDYENVYINRILKLSKLIDDNFCKIHLESETTNLKEVLLRHARKTKLIVTVRLTTEDTLTGFVYDINDEFTILNVLDEDGKPDGKSAIKTEFIDRIWCDSGYERNVHLLYKAEKDSLFYNSATE